MRFLNRFAINARFVAGLLILVAGLAGVIVFITDYWSEEKRFPYAKYFPDIHFSFKGQNSMFSRQSSYTVTSGDIEGEAVLTPVSTAKAGRSIVNSQLVGINSVYAKMRAPYAGQITSYINCGTKKFVQEKSLSFDNSKTVLILGVANSRRIFGTCSLDQITYVSAFWSAYDEQKKRVLTIKLFKPLSHLESVGESQQELLELFQQLNHQSSS